MYKTLCVVVVSILLNCLTVSAQVNNKKLGGQSFTGEITVNQSLPEVWKVLTDMQKISEVMGYEYSGAAQFTKPGDSVNFSVWGDSGTYILIYSKSNSELRFVWEPDNASYLCQARWRLIAAGKSTKIMFEDRYTESGPQSPEDIAAQVKSYNEALGRLKAICEGK